jgi:hypothetical protein
MTVYSFDRSAAKPQLDSPVFPFAFLFASRAENRCGYGVIHAGWPSSALPPPSTSPFNTPLKMSCAMAAASATTAVVQGAAGIKGQKLRQGVRAGVARRARSVATSAKAVAEAGPVVRINQAEWNKLGQVCAVLGSQWGDEGKGKLVDILAQVR